VRPNAMSHRRQAAMRSRAVNFCNTQLHRDDGGQRLRTPTGAGGPDRALQVPKSLECSRVLFF
jgi:hypothetical protein